MSRKNKKVWTDFMLDNAFVQVNKLSNSAFIKQNLSDDINKSQEVVLFFEEIEALYLKMKALQEEK